jgi:hypothetical protein
MRRRVVALCAHTARGLALVALAITAALVLPAVAHAAVISSWALATGAGDAIDGNDGTAQNVVFSGSYATFNGATSRITIPYASNLSPGSADVSMSVQVNTTHMPGTGTLDYDVIRSAPKGPYYKTELVPSNGRAQALCFFKGSLAHVQLRAGPSLNDGAWHTIVCSKTANRVTLTVDGTQVGSKTVTIGSIVHRSGSVFALGYKPVPGGSDEDFFNGQMRNASVSIS